MWEAGSWPSLLEACGLFLPESGQCPSLGQARGDAACPSPTILSLCWCLGPKGQVGWGPGHICPAPGSASAPGKEGIEQANTGVPQPGALSLASEPMGLARPHCRALCAPGPTWPLFWAPTADLPSCSSGFLQWRERSWPSVRSEAPAALPGCLPFARPLLRSTNGWPRPWEAARNVNVHSMRGRRCPDRLRAAAVLGVPTVHRVRVPAPSVTSSSSFYSPRLNKGKGESSKGVQTQASVSGGEQVLPLVFFLF